MKNARILFFLGVPLGMLGVLQLLHAADDEPHPLPEPERKALREEFGQREELLDLRIGEDPKNVSFYSFWEISFSRACLF